jgi:hypothetical protein
MKRAQPNVRMAAGAQMLRYMVWSTPVFWCRRRALAFAAYLVHAVGGM